MLSSILAGIASQSAYAQQEQQSAKHSAEQIQALAAPIALYPDALVAKILCGAIWARGRSVM